jgi:hypothetical protein
MIAPIRPAACDGGEQGGQDTTDQIANTLDGQISRRIVSEVLGVERIVSLARKDCCHSVSPNSFNRGQNAQLVIDHDVMPCWKSLFDVDEHLLFVAIVLRPKNLLGFEL